MTGPPSQWGRDTALPHRRATDTALAHGRVLTHSHRKTRRRREVLKLINSEACLGRHAEDDIRCIRQSCLRRCCNPHIILSPQQSSGWFLSLKYLALDIQIDREGGPYGLPAGFALDNSQQPAPFRSGERLRLQCEGAGRRNNEALQHKRTFSFSGCYSRKRATAG